MRRYRSKACVTQSDQKGWVCDYLAVTVERPELICKAVVNTPVVDWSII